jgi:hypothetical protein
MKKIFAGFILPLLILSFTVLSSCKDKGTKQLKQVEEKEVDTLKSQIGTHVYPLPTSAEVIKMLSDLEVGFQFGITNPVENSKKYFTQAKKALNLGAYGADLSYSTLYNQQQKVFDYLEVIRMITSDLNMSKIYNEDLYNKIKENADNKDKLVEILTNAFNDTYVYLSDNDQQNLALLVVGGAWVEGMYLTCHVSEAAYQVAGISGVLLQQKESFDTYLEITKLYLSDPLVGDFVKSLDPIKQVYAGIGTSLTNQNIMDITKVINDLREKVVQ